MQLAYVREMHYTCREKKQKAKICKTCLDAALVQRWRSARTHPSSRVKYIGRFWIQEFRQDDENGLWDFAPEIGPRIRGIDKKFQEYFLVSIRLAAPLWYLASGDFFSNVILHIFCKNVSRNTFLYYGFVICNCTSNKHASRCKSSITVRTPSFDHILTAQLQQIN